MARIFRWCTGYFRATLWTPVGYHPYFKSIRGFLISFRRKIWGIGRFRFCKMLGWYRLIFISKCLGWLEAIITGVRRTGQGAFQIISLKRLLMRWWENILWIISIRSQILMTWSNQGPRDKRWIPLSRNPQLRNKSRRTLFLHLNKCRKLKSTLKWRFPMSPHQSKRGPWK